MKQSSGFVELHNGPLELKICLPLRILIRFGRTPKGLLTPLVRRIVEVYHKTQKCCFWIWLCSRYKIPEFFTIAPVLTSTLTICRRNLGDPSSLYRT